jgi:hypothetical protein
MSTRLETARERSAGFEARCDDRVNATYPTDDALIGGAWNEWHFRCRRSADTVEYRELERLHGADVRAIMRPPRRSPSDRALFRL